MYKRKVIRDGFSYNRGLVTAARIYSGGDHPLARITHNKE